MKPNNRSIFDLFDGKRRYVVPLFQRQYVWNEEEDWAPLWEDLERKFTEQLQGEQDRPPHFLGAMVIDQKRTYGNEIPAHLVIDGQQRLTTFQIFLAVFRDLARAHGDTESANECERYIANTGKMSHADERFKVWPTNTDREQFQSVISAGSRDALLAAHPPVRRKYARQDDPRPRMVECYLYFYAHLEEFLTRADGEGSSPQRIEKVFHALQSALQVVTIELDGADDPQVIFETLNARGQPLLPSDLLRNYIFLRCGTSQESAEELHTVHWRPFDEPFWQTVTKQGRFKRPRTDLFFQHYLASKVLDEVNVGQLYSQYKRWIRTAKPFPDVVSELKDLSKNRETYRQLLEPTGEGPLSRLATVLSAFEVSPAHPLVLGLMSRDPDSATVAAVCRDLESYVVRRAFCGLTNKNYNRVFLSVLSRVVRGEITPDTLRSDLSGLTGDSGLWPRDDTFREAWLHTSAYSNLGPARCQYILRAIERAHHDSRTERIEILSDLTIEHVLPQEWYENWPLPDGRPGLSWRERYEPGADESQKEASALRDRFLHRIGNLTLLTQPLNSSVRHGPFTVKRPEIVKNSALALNRYFQELGSWDEGAIEQRAGSLFEAALREWPPPA